MDNVTPLRIVHGETGEQLGEDCPHCHETDLANRTLRSQLTRLKNEQAKAREKEAVAGDVIDVLSFWRDTLAPRAGIDAGSDNWDAVAKLLVMTDAQTGERRFTPLTLKAAVRGMLADEWIMERGHSHRRRPQNAWRDPARVDELVERARGFKERTGVSGLRLIDALGERALAWLAYRCRCTHTWLEHLRFGGTTADGRQPCSTCTCSDFDMHGIRDEQALQELAEQERQRDR